MDFIEGLLKSHGKDVILVVVDRLSKYAHFIALSHPFPAIDVSRAFLENIYKLYGFPKSIVSDRDIIFVSSYHPQTDGQSEVLNRCLEGYLRCMCHDAPTDWTKWLPLAEYWYNTNFHSTINCTPFEVVYGQAPPLQLPYLQGESKVDYVDRSLTAGEEAIKLLKQNLHKAQNRMKQTADKHRSERIFYVGDWV